MHDTCELL